MVRGVVNNGRRLARDLAALVACLGAVGAVGAADEISVVSPRHLATVIGPTTIELSVRPPDGLTVEAVEVSVDGALLRRLTAPPWQIEWDAGDASRGRLIEVVATWSDGTTARAVSRTSALRINQVEDVDLVDVYPLVRDRGGDYVADLTKDDFVVLENGVPQEILRFSRVRKPLRVALVIDTSLTMSREGRLESAKSAALSFLDTLADDDEGLVVTFSDDVRVAQDITSDRDLLAAAVAATESGGGTALYDAIWRTSKMLEEFDGRRVVVLLSDGRDEAANGFEPGSLHTLEESVEQALRSEVMVFSIGLGRNLDELLDFQRRHTLEEILRRLSDSTGGRALFSPRSGQLRKAFRDVSDDLRNQYAISYQSSDPGHGGEWRSIEVRTPNQPRLEVVAREGYFARDDRRSSAGGGAAGVGTAGTAAAP